MMAITPVSVFSPPAAEDVDRGLGLVTMHNSLMPFTDSSSGQSHRAFAYLDRIGVSVLKSTSHVPPVVVAEGVDVLRFLLSYATPDFERVMRSHCIMDSNGPPGGLFFVAAWGAMQNMLQSVQPDPTSDQLTNLALAIFEQTARPLKLPMSAADGALEHALSGPRLRWETLAMCCILIGLYNSSPSNPGIALHYSRGQRKTARQEVLLKAYDVCMQCRSFCDRLDQVNDLTLWLMISANLFATWGFGDDSHRAFRLMGDVTSTVYALGFHRDVKGEEPAPVYLVEYRKRAVAFAHELDKGQATFVGRPPSPKS